MISVKEDLRDYSGIYSENPPPGNPCIAWLSETLGGYGELLLTRGNFFIFHKRGAHHHTTGNFSSGPEISTESPESPCLSRATATPSDWICPTGPPERRQSEAVTKSINQYNPIHDLYTKIGALIMNDTTATTDEALKAVLKKQVAKRLDYLTAGDRFPLASILGETFWEEEDVPHTTLGKAFSSLVECGELPFQASGWTSNRNNEYIYTPGNPPPTTNGVSDTPGQGKKEVIDTSELIITRMQYKLLGEVDRRLRNLTPGEAYTLADIFDGDCWIDPFPGPSQAGRAFSDLVERGFFASIQSSGKNTKGTKQYLYNPQ